MVQILVTAHPVFEDIDSDGDLDLFVGNYNGTILFFENIGNENIFEYSYISEILNVDVAHILLQFLKILILMGI